MLVDALRYDFSGELNIIVQEKEKFRILLLRLRFPFSCTSYRLDEKMTYVFCFLIDISKQTNRIDASDCALKVIDV